jgi:hypothetical protein
VGHYENGDTLVVDTIGVLVHRYNFVDNYRTPHTDQLHVVERFTLVDDDTIRYQFTVEDPATWTRPWTAEITMRRFPDRIFEYACHEGNHDLTFLLALAQKEMDK